MYIHSLKYFVLHTEAVQSTLELVNLPEQIHVKSLSREERDDREKQGGGVRVMKMERQR